MKFISTRGQSPALGFSDAVATGLAPDGGLYVPESFPDLSAKLSSYSKLGYADLCAEFLSHFATDIPVEELRALARASYASFDTPEVAPLVRLDDETFVLELFHGPTLAFKDFALQLLGNLYARQCALRNQSINVLGATSGDTGSAAIHGLLGKPGTAIFILYPDGRTSPLQERQMACTGAPNVFALAVDGTFDDAQAALKDVFGDQQFRIHHRLSAVNSINLARVLAQCAYYLWAWLRLPTSLRGNSEFVVPTGNFGNVLAGWMLRQMGVPIPGFRVATNQNDILHRLFQTGVYSVGDVQPSLAPSMDIQVASNFERFLYFSLGRDGDRVRQVMANFKATGRHEFPKFDRDCFASSRCDDAEIAGIMKSVYSKYNYIADPHTACGFKDLRKGRTSVILSTAHPAKFPETIVSAIGVEPTHASLEQLKQLPLRKHLLKARPADIKAFIEQHAV